jgi:hypothetical protein
MVETRIRRDSRVLRTARVDATNADALALFEDTGVTSVVVPGSTDGSTVRDLFVLGVLEPVLNDFVANAGNAPSTRDRIAGGVIR